MNNLRLYTALIIMAGLLIGTSSGGFVNEPTKYYKPEWTSIPVGFISDYVSPFAEPKFKNLWDAIDPDPIIPEEPEPAPAEPVPAILPEPLPISKEQIANSMITISKQKQSLISSLSS